MSRLEKNNALMRANIEAMRKTQDDAHKRLIADKYVVEGIEDVLNLDENKNPVIGMRMSFDTVLAYKEASIKSLRPDLEKAEMFSPGREKGSKTKKTLHIQRLCSDNPSLSAKELRDLADCNIIGDMAAGTFANHVTAARKNKK